MSLSAILTRMIRGVLFKVVFEKEWVMQMEGNMAFQEGRKMSPKTWKQGQASRKDFIGKAYWARVSSWDCKEGEGQAL